MPKQRQKMSKLEASYHENAAGMAASHEMSQGDPDALANNALVDSVGDIPEACGWRMFPLTVGTLITQTKAKKAVAEYLDNDPYSDETDCKFIMGAIDDMCFADPCRVNDILRAGLVADLAAEANRLNYVPFVERKKLMDHKAAQLAIFAGVAGAETPEQSDKRPGK